MALIAALVIDTLLTRLIIKWRLSRRKNIALRWLTNVAVIALTLGLGYGLMTTLIGKTFTVESTSMEGTLLKGDRVWVSKVAYGPRTIIGRLSGRDSVSRGDIVVFNLPGKRLQSLVKRVVGLPGETLSIRHDTIFNNGKPFTEPAYVQHNHFIQTDGREINDIMWNDLHVNADEHRRARFEGDSIRMPLEVQGFAVDTTTGIPHPVYEIPLSDEGIKRLALFPWIVGVKRLAMEQTAKVFPVNYNMGWHRSNYGPVTIPKKGMTIDLTPTNLPIYEDVITACEGHSVKIKDGKIVIDGKVTDKYTFRYDYFWLMGDNRDYSEDSRNWGFVPMNCIVGKATCVISSKNELLKYNYGPNAVTRKMIDLYDERNKESAQQSKQTAK